MATAASSASPVEADLCAWIEAVAVRSDRAAFARLYGHFAPKLKAYSRRSGADPATADELCQETMLTVWRKAHLFDRRQAAVSTWIFTIVRNKRIDRVRRETRPVLQAHDLEGWFEPPATAEEGYLAAEAGERLRRSLGSLPPEQIEVLRKAYFEDKSHSQISAELRLPLGTVKSRIRLATDHLRRAFLRSL